MKKVTLTDLNGKEIEVYFADDKTVESSKHSSKHSDEYNVKIENVPSNKNWFDMTGGGLEQAKKVFSPDEPVSEEGLELSFYESLNQKFLNKVKGLEEPQSQISIDDTIPSDFVELSELRNGAIYKVVGLNLTAKLVSKQFDDYSALLKMKRHDTVFYVEEGSLMKATDSEVERYLEE